MKSTTPPKARKDGKARIMTSSENSRGWPSIVISDNPDDVGKTYAVHELSDSADAARIEAVAKVLFEHSWHPTDEPGFIRELRGPVPTWKQLITEHPENTIVRNCRAKSKQALLAIGALSAGVKK
jgi:hypothetical protein